MSDGERMAVCTNLVRDGEGFHGRCVKVGVNTLCGIGKVTGPRSDFFSALSYQNYPWMAMASGSAGVL